MLQIVLSVAVFAQPAPPAPDFDAPLREARTGLDSLYLQDQVLAAMAAPYKYGVTQMPCKARDWQPLRGWTPAREPSGRIRWVHGPVTHVRWSGIYGTCFIQSPVPREQMGLVERTALECECNGWQPRPVGIVPWP